MSARASYEPPVFRIHEHWAASGSERRNPHPINRLARTLDRLCLEASDPYEIAAHLEALGYNNAEVVAQYGVADHFELAQALFYRTPRRWGLSRPHAKVQRNYTEQLIMALTLLVTAAIGLFAVVSAWLAVIWLLVWSQLGGMLLNRAKGELSPQQQSSVLSLLLELGLGGLVVVWFLDPFWSATWSVSLIWLSVAALLWLGRWRAAATLPALVGGLLLLVAGLELPFLIMPLGTVATSLWLLRPDVRRVPRACWVWALAQWRYALPLVLYGLGQGSLLVALLRDAEATALPGLALFALILMGAESQLQWLRGRLNLYLWKGESVSAYVRFARRTLLRYTGMYLLPFLPALGVYLWLGPKGAPWLFGLLGFALFGLLLGLGLVFLSLGDPLVPALVFATGGALLVAGLPFFWVAGSMALVQFAALLWRSASLGRYGIYLV